MHHLLFPPVCLFRFFLFVAMRPVFFEKYIVLMNLRQCFTPIYHRADRANEKVTVTEQ